MELLGACLHSRFLSLIKIWPFSKFSQDDDACSCYTSRESVDSNALKMVLLPDYVCSFTSLDQVYPSQVDPSHVLVAKYMRARVCTKV